MTDATGETAFVEKPLLPKWRKKELIGLLDTSGSMELPCAAGSHVTRRQLLGEALPILVAALEGEDSAAKDEQAGGSDEKGGLLIHGFADLHTELGDFNSSNFRHRWANIIWGGTTNVMPAWKAALSDYTDEFGDEDEPRALEVVLLTDGEATDWAEFGKVISTPHPDRYFLVCIVGYGPAHDATLKAYQAAEAANPKHVKVISMDSVTDPNQVAKELIFMAGIGG